MKKAVVLLANGYEEIEALTVVDVMRRAGVLCHMCSMDGIVTAGSHNIEIKADIEFEGTDFGDYDVLVLPGGMPGSVNLRDDERVIEIIKRFAADGKIIGAICAAPIVLEKAGVIKDERVTSHPSVENQLIGCAYVEDLTVECGNIITSRGPATSIYFALQILKKIGLEEKANELKKGMMLQFVEESCACNKPVDRHN